MYGDPSSRHIHGGVAGAGSGSGAHPRHRNPGQPSRHSLQLDEPSLKAYHSVPYQHPVGTHVSHADPSNGGRSGSGSGGGGGSSWGPVQKAVQGMNLSRSSAGHRSTRTFPPTHPPTSSHQQQQQQSSQLGVAGEGALPLPPPWAVAAAGVSYPVGASYPISHRNSAASARSSAVALSGGALRGSGGVGPASTSPPPPPPPSSPHLLAARGSNARVASGAGGGVGAEQPAIQPLVNYWEATSQLLGSYRTALQERDAVARSSGDDGASPVAAAAAGGSDASHQAEAQQQWVEEPWPGVHLFLRAAGQAADAANITPQPAAEVFKVRFSRHHFTPDMAAAWWAEHRPALADRYILNIHFPEGGGGGGGNGTSLPPAAMMASSGGGVSGLNNAVVASRQQPLAAYHDEGLQQQCQGQGELGAPGFLGGGGQGEAPARGSLPLPPIVMSPAAAGWVNPTTEEGGASRVHAASLPSTPQQAGSGGGGARGQRALTSPVGSTTAAPPSHGMVALPEEVEAVLTDMWGPGTSDGRMGSGSGGGSVVSVQARARPGHMRSRSGGPSAGGRSLP